MTTANPVREKLAEAKYFLKQMEELKESHQEFKYNLSAFLSAARSVTFVLQKHCKHVEAFEEWYAPVREVMRRDRVLAFFKELRNIALKEGRLPVSQQDDYHIELRKGPDNDTLVYLVEVEEGVRTIRASADVADPNDYIARAVLGRMKELITYHWRFEDLPEQLGPKNDVLRLGAYYVDRLDQVVAEALDRFAKGGRPNMATHQTGTPASCVPLDPSSNVL